MAERHRGLCSRHQHSRRTTDQFVERRERRGSPGPRASSESGNRSSSNNDSNRPPMPGPADTTVGSSRGKPAIGLASPDRPPSRVARKRLVAGGPVRKTCAELVEQEGFGVVAVDQVAHGMGGADQAVRRACRSPGSRRGHQIASAACQPAWR